MTIVLVLVGSVQQALAVAQALATAGTPPESPAPSPDAVVRTRVGDLEIETTRAAIAAARWN